MKLSTSRLSSLRQVILASLLSLSLLFFPFVSHAIHVESVPNPRAQYGEWVSDVANILSADTESQLNQMIGELEAENGIEIAVVTVPETQPYSSPKEFTTALFNHWEIGKADEDNGILLMISKGDRRVEIETGYGIEPILPDAQVGKILETHMLPYFKQDDFDTGTLQGTRALISAVSQQEGTPPTVVPPLSFPDFETVSVMTLPERHILWIMSAGLAGLGILSYGLARLLCRPILLERGTRSRVEFNQSPEGRYAFGQNLLYASSWLAVFALSLIALSGGIWVFLVLLILTTFQLLFRGVAQAKPQKALFPIVSLIFGILVVITFVFLNLIFISFLIVAATLISLLVAFVFAPTLYNQLKRNRNFEMTYLDAQTQQPLEPVALATVNSYLTEAEKVAQQLASVRYQGFQFPRGEVQIRALVLNTAYRECPHCHELTVERRQQTLKKPTYAESGTSLITESCACCDYYTETRKTIPRLVRSSSSYGGGSSGGSSFGGGSSGGGGAGGRF